MRKKISFYAALAGLAGFACVLFVFFGAGKIFAAAPQITGVTYKAAGDSNKILVTFDQPVAGNIGGTSPLGIGSFALGGASGTLASIVAADHSAMPPSNIAVLNLDTTVNPTAPGKWTIAPALNSVFAGGLAASSTVVTDLIGQGDNVAPTVLGVFQHSLYNLDIMFSEVMDTATASGTPYYVNLVTASTTDTSGITAAQLTPEKNFAILTVSATTALSWGAGNTIDVGAVRDAVGNASTATSSLLTILPPVKISEVKIGGTGNTQDEFVELYNFGDISVSTANLYLHIRNGGTDSNISLTKLKASLPDHGYYLIGSSAFYSGSVALDATYNTSAVEMDGNSGVYISASSAADTLVIDKLGMGLSAIKETATTTALVAGKSYERKAQRTSDAGSMFTGGGDEFKGNSYDSNNNSSDFVLQNTPKPQNSASPKEFPFGGPGSNDNTPPQVQGSFPSGAGGEMVPNNLQFIGFDFSKQVDQSTVSTGTVKLFLNPDTSTNLCSSVVYSNSPAPGSPPGKCVIAPGTTLSGTYTFKVLGGGSGVKDLSNNALNQQGAHGVSGNYVITFTPSGGGGGFTFTAPSVFVMGAAPFPGSVNVPTNIQKIYVKFSGDASTSTLISANITLTKVGGSAVSVSGVTYAASENNFTSNLAVVTLGATLTANSQYLLSVNNVQDTSNRSVSAFSANFSTGSGSDITGPAVTGKLPSITAGVPVSAIDVHVMTDDKLEPGSISSDTVKMYQGNNQIPGTVNFDPFTGEIIFMANNVFLPSTLYQVSLSASGTSPCVQNIVGLCLQDNDGNANNLYEFTFTTGAADVNPPKVMFANADQQHLSVSFDKPMIKTEVENLDNYALTVGGATTTLSAMSGNSATYDPVSRTANISNLNLATGGSYTITVSNVHDLSGNVIGATNSAQGTVQDMGKTGGFVGPGGGGGGGGGMGFAPADNFKPANFGDTFGFVPQVEVRPMSPQVSATTTYTIELPISKQIKTATGKIVLTFPTGFDVSSAAADTNDPMSADVNGPGSGAIGITSVTPDAVARTVTVVLNSNTRCDAGNAAPCSGDSHDFLHLSVKNIVNSSIPKDSASGGYTVDVKTMDSSTVLESLTSRTFYLAAGGSRTITVVLTTGAGGLNTGTATVRLFSPMTGPRESLTTTFTAGIATATFASLLDGGYGISTDPIITLGGADYQGRMMPTPVFVSGSDQTVNLLLTAMTGLTSVTVNVTAPAGKSVDVFANSNDKFTVKTIASTSGSDTVTLKLIDGTWYVGVGPTMPKGQFSGPPPAPDFTMQPPVQVIVSGSTVKENSGTANDGTVEFTLGTAGKTLAGTVVDGTDKPVVGAEVFAYNPMGGFGTHGSSDASGAFSLKVAAGMFQVGAFNPGMPPAGETAVEVRSDGTMYLNGATSTSITIKLIKPGRTISGKVTDQTNNPVQGAGVFAYCDPAVGGNTCFGPGDHSGSQTSSDGTYTLYVKSGTWKIGAFIPSFGEMPTQTQAVTTADVTGVDFSPSSNTTFNTISGTVCRDTDASGNATTCGSGDSKSSGVFVRANSASGANQTVTGTDGAYTIKAPASASYTLEAFDPSMGRLGSLTADISSISATNKDFVIGNPRAITVNVKDSNGNFVSVNNMFVDFFDYTTKSGNHLEIKNATSSSISLPDGNYHIRAGFSGKILGDAAIASDTPGTVVSAATLTVDGNKTIKVILPSLGVISGTVYKTAATGGNELANALVQLADKANGIFFSAQANDSGVYSVSLPVGTYNVLAQKPGYFGSSVAVTSSSTAATTQNLIATPSTYTISGTVTISGAAASQAFVRAKKLGGGFSSVQTDSNGVYVVPVSAGVWQVYAVASGYEETEYASDPIEISNASVTDKTIDLTTKVTLTAPKVCQITPVQGGECADDVNGIKVTVPPGAFGSGSDAVSLTIKQSNVFQQTSGSKPAGTGYSFEAVDGSGSKISTFNSALTLEFTQAKAVLVNDGMDTKTKIDGMKIMLWSETIKDYDVLVTTVDYLDGSNNLVASPADNLSNVTNIRFKALTSHFSSGGPGGPGDSLAPAAPTGVSGTGGSSSIAVSWSTVSTNSDGTAIADLSDYRVWRSASAGSGYAVIGTVSAPTVSYTDSTASAGTTYYYKASARDTNGNESAQSSASGGVSRVASSSGGGGGTATVGPTNTSVAIANGAATTTSANITLALAASGASQMVISNDSGFASSTWQSFATSSAWRLTAGNGLKTVYAKFKDASGNISTAVSDTITLSASETDVPPATNSTSTPPGLMAPSITPAPAGTHPNGTLVLDGKTVYLIKDGKRVGFRNPEEYKSHGYSFGQAVAANAHDKAMPQAEFVEKALEGTLVLDAQDGKTVYMVGANNTKRGFTSAAVFKALGYSFANLLKINLSDYSAGPAITSGAQTHPDGALVLDGRTVWWILGGTKQGFESMAVFNTYGFSSAKIVKSNSADLALPQGPLVKFRDGTLVKDGANYYLISDGKKLQFASVADLTGRGYKTANAISARLVNYETGSGLW